MRDRIADHITAGTASGFGNHCIADAIIAEFIQWGEGYCTFYRWRKRGACPHCWQEVKNENHT